MVLSKDCMGADCLGVVSLLDPAHVPIWRPRRGLQHPTGTFRACAAPRPFPSLVLVGFSQDELQLLDMTLLDGCAQPTVAVLYQDNREARHVRTYKIDTAVRADAIVWTCARTRPSLTHAQTNPSCDIVRLARPPMDLGPSQTLTRVPRSSLPFQPPWVVW